MSDDEVFKRFKANTLKYLIKWIDKPTDKHCVTLLEKNIDLDKQRHNGNTTPRRLSTPVQKQLATINKLSAIKKQFMRNVLNDTKNLKNNLFINNVLNTLGLNANIKNTNTNNKTNKTNKNTIINNNNSDIFNNFKIDSANELITAYKQNEIKLNEFQTKINAFKQKLSTLNELKLDSNLFNSGIETAVQNVETELNKCISEEKCYKFRHQTLIKIIRKIKKLQNKILQSKKTKTLQQILEKIILTKNDSKTKYSLKLNTLQQNDNKIKQQLIIICSNTNDFNINKLNELKIQQKTIVKDKKDIMDNINNVQIFIDGIKQLLNEIIFNQPIDHTLWLNGYENCSSSYFSAVTPNKKVKPHRNRNTNIIINTNTLPPVITNINTHKIMASLPSVVNMNMSMNKLALPSMTVTNNNIPSLIPAIVNIPTIVHSNPHPPAPKKKFKRPTRSKAVKAKRISISDVLPKQLCPIKLSQTFLSNGSIRNHNESMFEMNVNVERENWINQYNSRHLPSITNKYKSLFGQNICFKPIQKDKPILKPNQAIQRMNMANVNTEMVIDNSNAPINPLTSPPPPPPDTTTTTTATTITQSNKKRKLDEIETNNDIDVVMHANKKAKIEINEENDDDCINSLSDDDMNENMNNNNDNVVNILAAPSPDNNPTNDINTYKRNSKQNLNINACKNNVFKPQNQKRHRVKTGLYNNNNRRRDNNNDIEKTHPLFQNDPLIKSLNKNIFENNCLHYMAKSICGYKDTGRCKYNHPLEYDAKNFYCPSLNKTNECNRDICKFTHNLKDIPCKDYYNAKCDRDNCFRSHEFTRDEFHKWNNAKMKKREAWQKWQALRNEKNEKHFNQRKNGNAWNKYEEKDERLNATDQQMFTSALTE